MVVVGNSETQGNGRCQILLSGGGWREAFLNELRKEVAGVAAFRAAGKPYVLDILSVM